MPQILQQLGIRTNPVIQGVKQARAMLGSLQNPQMMLNQIMNQNPQVQQIINQYGSVDGAIRAVCEQKGIDYQEFVDALK